MVVIISILSFLFLFLSLSLLFFSSLFLFSFSLLFFFFSSSLFFFFNNKLKQLVIKELNLYFGSGTGPSRSLSNKRWQAICDGLWSFFSFDNEEDEDLFSKDGFLIFLYFSLSFSLTLLSFFSLFLSFLLFSFSLFLSPFLFSSLLSFFPLLNSYFFGCSKSKTRRII